MCSKILLLGQTARQSISLHCTVVAPTQQMGILGNQNFTAQADRRTDGQTVKKP